MAHPATGAAQKPDVEKVLRQVYLELDLDRFEAHWDGKPVVLTITEFGIVRTLLSYPGKVFTRDELISGAYTYDNIVARQAFTVCVPSAAYVKEADYLGIASGRDEDKFARAGLTEIVEVRVGEALKLMAEMSETFDLIFLDIDKESYLPALSLCRRLLRSGGLLVADNVGFSGAADFNREIMENPAWRAVHLLSFLPRHSPEHDGLALAVKEGRSGRLW